MRKKIRIGDRIKFKAATRSSYRVAVRKVNGFTPDGRPTVGYHGWSNFVVEPHEIIDRLDREG
ncbi:hypothetical protein [Novosphingobium sp. UBA1939]|uniref:hypothetical protein n=1 Tax=Novosphingobium sp. UBA1939 TaxID=1946982 RepID=UPI0025E9416A|nr:hypothetical protein [Novosphingobium sp. UBA1939]